MAVTDLAFEKAVEQPELYVALADVCKKLDESEVSMKLKGKTFPLTSTQADKKRVLRAMQYENRGESSRRRAVIGNEFENDPRKD